jgi:hypothetical protein
MSKLILGIIIAVIVIIIVVIVVVVTMPPTDALDFGCVECSVPGSYWCPAGVVSSSESWNGLASLVSTYRLPQYDPVDPNAQVGGTKYYWRQLADSCGTS